MPEPTHTDLLNRFVEAVNSGDLDAMAAMAPHDYFDYSPRPDQDSASETYRKIFGDLVAAFPDFHVTTSDVTDNGDLLTGKVKFGGTHTGILWNMPPTGAATSADAEFDAKIDSGKLAFRLRGFDMTRTLRMACVIPQPEDMWRKRAFSINIPTMLMVLAFNGGTLREKECRHVDLIRFREPTSRVCKECEALHAEWPSLRMCLVCGYVGCCDTSIHRHIRHHYEETGHPIYRSIDPGHAWVWCYDDAAVLSGLVDPA